MAVNNMSIENAYALIAELHEQATGQKVAAPVNSAAQKPPKRKTFILILIFLSF